MGRIEFTRAGHQLGHALGCGQARSRPQAVAQALQIDEQARGQQVEVEQFDGIGGGGVHGRQEPGVFRDGDAHGRKALAHRRLVGHLGQHPGVDQTAAATAGAAIQRRLVGVVLGLTLVADDEHEA